jgi:UDP-N-acetylglucosamine/UDP-N-acetylgalactosamine diphosphorylase
MDVPNELLRKLRDFGQEHVLAWWDRIPDTEQKELLEQLTAIDLSQLSNLYGNRDRTFSLPPPDHIRPIPIDVLSPDDASTRRLGEDAIQHGQVAVLVVAGGQASRLGVDFPKGMFAIGPVSDKTLFQIHAEKVLALSRRHQSVVPLLVMTSPATHDQTEQFFADHAYFGLPPDDVFFFRQGTMPALDMATGRLLLEGPARLFTSPNGHGGTLTALVESGLLDFLSRRGIRDIFYFQVDNPLVRVADPQFVGHHRARNAEVSSKIVRKEGPADKLGNMVLVDGRCTIIEYSDLPEQLARERGHGGRLRFEAGSPAIHIFSLDFLKRIMRSGPRVPYHVARKKVPYLDRSGKLIQPERENALKFEMFIFDVLPLADQWTVVDTSRPEEFVPLKNASGPDSPATVRQALTDLYGSWLEYAGIHVPRKADGTVAVPIEISPLFALDKDQLAARLDKSFRVDGPSYLEKNGRSQLSST